jgi:hypothetical protein
MEANLTKINNFLQKHHLLSLATSGGDELSVCSLFYVFDKESHSFVVASSLETRHIADILEQPLVAGSVALETRIVGKIEGVQFKGRVRAIEEERLKILYLKKFPYAAVMNPKLWSIEVSFFKLTDNKLGFGTKIIWHS